ncbi:MAG: hypothetical protein Q7U47_06495 [Paludibacter sp.]|nr:hypothetical protein [Paludibacter sp.]
MSYPKNIIPVVSKRNLLLVAASVWLFAGLMLLTKGKNLYFLAGGTWDLMVLISIVAGIVFYAAVFSKVSSKHIERIFLIKDAYPRIFQVFDKRSYLLMVLMMTMGFAIRKSGAVPLQYIALFYIAMGTPLIISAFKFVYSRIKKRK